MIVLTSSEEGPCSEEEAHLRKALERFYEKRQIKGHRNPTSLQYQYSKTTQLIDMKGEGRRPEVIGNLYENQ